MGRNHAGTGSFGNTGEFYLVKKEQVDELERKIDTLKEKLTPSEIGLHFYRTLILLLIFVFGYVLGHIF